MKDSLKLIEEAVTRLGAQGIFFDKKYHSLLISEAADCLKSHGYSLFKTVHRDKDDYHFYRKGNIFVLIKDWHRGGDTTKIYFSGLLPYSSALEETFPEKLGGLRPFKGDPFFVLRNGLDPREDISEFEAILNYFEDKPTLPPDERVTYWDDDENDRIPILTL